MSVSYLAVRPMCNLACGAIGLPVDNHCNEHHVGEILLLIACDRRSGEQQIKGIVLNFLLINFPIPI